MTLYIDLAQNLADHTLLWLLGAWALGLATGLIPRRKQQIHVQEITTDPDQADLVGRLLMDNVLLEDILGSIWLYIKWRYVTKQLTTPEKERFADAVEASHRRLNDDEPEYADAWRIERWWRE